MNPSQNIHFLFLLLLLIPLSVSSQAYFKRLDQPAKFFTQKVTHFSNGDLLIGNSSVEAAQNGTGGSIFLTRFDPCGNRVWSQAYERDIEYLEFKDFRITPANEILVYGSAYEGLNEFIFLMKLSGKGDLLKFVLFQPGAVDHFSYNMDLQGNLLMIYGLLLDFGSKKHGFIATFDDQLNYQWSKKFTPFESIGAAYITRDQGFICRFGDYVTKLNQTGTIDWGLSMTRNSGNGLISGPLEINDGYLLQAYGEGYAFFYKLDLAGNLVWKSDRFPSNSFGADVSILPDGNFLAVYSSAATTGNHLWSLTLSPRGEIIGQQQLDLDLSIKPGQVSQSLSSENSLAIAGNTDVTVPLVVDVSSFLLQTPWPPTANDCYQWIDQQTNLPNDITLDLVPWDTVILNNEMQLVQSTTMSTSSFDIPLDDACGNGADQNFIQIDTLLACGDNWTVPLPSEAFSWADEVSDNPRIIDIPGTYQAKNEDCGNPIVYEYTLSKPVCACEVYLPTAFSPNQDGRNDQLEFFSACQLLNMEMLVFNRWGKKVFESQTPEHFWDGYHQNRLAMNGVYLVVINYQWIAEDGTTQSGNVHQTITLLK